ncbi:hypothetical protein M1N50_00910 [Dehalococcoidia bacterium]|nr:hypothetical protein [Dehalococcoidia bacterium]
MIEEDRTPGTIPGPLGTGGTGSVWLPADLHLHSRFSDGVHCLKHLRDVDPGLKAMGYRVIYMADHVGTVAENLQRDFCICNHPDHGCPCCDCGLTSPTTWECYFRNTQLVSTPQIAFFPGVEIDTRIHEGHALIYGLNNLNRADGGGEFFCGDLTGPGLVKAIPAGSSLAIAHPEPWWPGWWWHNWNWGTIGYRGAEVMGPGPETHFSWWRGQAFTPQALQAAVDGQGVLSVRTGSDYHHHGHWPFAQHITYLRVSLLNLAGPRLGYSPVTGEHGFEGGADHCFGVWRLCHSHCKRAAAWKRDL